jgi:hypothetical protein
MRSEQTQDWKRASGATTWLANNSGMANALVQVPQRSERAPAAGPSAADHRQRQLAQLGDAPLRARQEPLHGQGCSGSARAGPAHSSARLQHPAPGGRLRSNRSCLCLIWAGPAPAPAWGTFTINILVMCSVSIAHVLQLASLSVWQAVHANRCQRPAASACQHSTNARSTW